VLRVTPSSTVSLGTSSSSNPHSNVTGPSNGGNVRRCGGFLVAIPFPPTPLLSFRDQACVLPLSPSVPRPVAMARSPSDLAQHRPLPVGSRFRCSLLTRLSAGLRLPVPRLTPAVTPCLCSLLRRLNAAVFSVVMSVRCHSDLCTCSGSLPQCGGCPLLQQ